VNYAYNTSQQNQNPNPYYSPYQQQQQPQSQQSVYPPAQYQQAPFSPLPPLVHPAPSAPPAPPAPSHQPTEPFFNQAISTPVPSAYQNYTHNYTNVNSSSNQYNYPTQPTQPSINYPESSQYASTDPSVYNPPYIHSNAYSNNDKDESDSDFGHNSSSVKYQSMAKFRHSINADSFDPTRSTISKSLNSISYPTDPATTTTTITSNNTNNFNNNNNSDYTNYISKSLTSSHATDNFDSQALLNSEQEQERVPTPAFTGQNQFFYDNDFLNEYVQVTAPAAESSYAATSTPPPAKLTSMRSEDSFADGQILHRPVASFPQPLQKSRQAFENSERQRDTYQAPPPVATPPRITSSIMKHTEQMDVCDDNHPSNKPPPRQVKFHPSI
jgi:hypothetical protein